MNGIPLFEQGDARDALKKRCREAKLSIKLLEELVEAEIEQIGKPSRHRLWEQFEQLIDSMAGGDGQED